MAAATHLSSRVAPPTPVPPRALVQSALAEATVVLVQSNPLVLRGLARFLGEFFARVVCAECPEKAEPLIVSERGSPLFIVAGQTFAGGNEAGPEALQRWRRDFAHVRLTVLATGSDVPLPSPSGIDAVFRKPAPPSELARLLLAAQARLSAPFPSH